MHSKLHKNQQKEHISPEISSIRTTIVIPGEITTPDIHKGIEEYQTTLRFSSNPRITKPGAAYELIKLGLESLRISKSTI